MKIERINENQIRCTLTSFDLSARNINIVELAYGTEKAKKLFREMIQRASNEVGFEAEDIPLIEDPEELDTRFARFSPAAEETQEEILPDPAGEFLEGAGDLGRLLSQHMADMTDSPQVPADSETASTKQIGKPLRIFLFEDLDRAAEAAAAVADICTVANALYKKPGTRQYYLVLDRRDSDEHGFSRICNILAEYGKKLAGDSAGEAYFKEHYETVIREQPMIRRPLQAKHTLRAVPHRELLFSDQFLLDITNFFEVYSVLIDIVSPIFDCYNYNTHGRLSWKHRSLTRSYLYSCLKHSWVYGFPFTASSIPVI